MPREWAGRWKGGRYYLNPDGQPVYVIERQRRTLTLVTHDEQLANGQLAQFLADPTRFTVRPPDPEGPAQPVYITDDRIKLYLAGIHKTVLDHRNARRAYLVAWSSLRLDLRTVDRRALRLALASFDGGHRGRTEALNAFARFLVREGELPSWNPLVNTRDSDPDNARAERVAYSVKELLATYARLPAGPIRDLFFLRVSTGLHHTEIEQLEGARQFSGPLPEKGSGIRTLEDKAQAIRGVLQVMHKGRRIHRHSVDVRGLETALRLRAGVPSRVTAWKALAPLVPSNLRHTFATLAGEIGEWITYTGGGVDRARVAQALGHRAGSTMTADRYQKVQIPPMLRLPIAWE